MKSFWSTFIDFWRFFLVTLSTRKAIRVGLRILKSTFYCKIFDQNDLERFKKWKPVVNVKNIFAGNQISPKLKQVEYAFQNQEYVLEYIFA